MVLCVVVILIFGDGKEIGNAFGVVVTMDMLITTILLTLVMITIWRTPPFLVAVFFIVFFTMESVYVSPVLTTISEGGWIPFAISFVLTIIMFGWFYGRQKKIDYELTNKIDLNSLKTLLSDPCVWRVPGLRFFCTNIQDGLTPVLGHCVKITRSLHKITIFTTLECLLVREVPTKERIIIKQLGIEGIYGCMIQYGYEDSLSLEGNDFVGQIIDRLQANITHNGFHSKQISPKDEQVVVDWEEIRRAEVVHIRGKARFYIGNNCSWFDKVMLAFYEVLHENCRSALRSLQVPLTQRIEVGMLYEA